VVGEIEEHEDDQHHEWHNDGKGPLGADLMFELAAPFEVHPGGQLNLFSHGPLGLVDEPDDVAVTNVELHIAAQQAIFAFDHRRTFGDVDVGDL
jgi:hypothetical protein